MTVVRPNSISGITSITAQTDTINFFKSDGTLQGLLLNGVNFNTTSGVSTFNALKVGTGQTLDASGINVTGVITATSYRGDGSGLTGVAATSNIRTNAITNSGVTTTDTLVVGTGGTVITTTATGNVGIGSTIPAARLDVLGGNGLLVQRIAGTSIARFGNTGNTKPNITVFGSSTTNEPFFGCDVNDLILGTSNVEKVRIDSNGGVGIGTTGPSNTMLQALGNHVGGHSIVKISRNDTNISSLGFYSQSKNRDGVIYTANDASLNFETVGFIQFTTNNASEKMRILTDGNVGIGSTVPTSKLTVTGDVRISGVGTATEFVSTSDINLKENITVIDNPITKLSELRGVTFDWKQGGSSVGVIAQDVEKIFPQAVRGEKNNKGVNYNAIIGLLVESIKEQQKEIDELKSRLDK